MRQVSNLRIIREEMNATNVARWSNTCSDAADKIEELEASLAAAIQDNERAVLQTQDALKKLAAATEHKQADLARITELEAYVKKIEAKLAAAKKPQFMAIGYVNKRDGCTSTTYEKLPDGERMLYVAIDAAKSDQQEA